MKHYEHHVEHFESSPDSMKLTNMGFQGWEVVAAYPATTVRVDDPKTGDECTYTTHVVLIFKRERSSGV